MSGDFGVVAGVPFCFGRGVFLGLVLGFAICFVLAIFGYGDSWGLVQKLVLRVDRSLKRDSCGSLNVSKAGSRRSIVVASSIAPANQLRAVIRSP